MSDLRLRDKICIVTGSTAGIGEAIAVLFAEHGARVVVSGRNETNGHRIVETIKGAGHTAAFVRCDVRVDEQVKGLIESTVNTFGGLHVLVNNAADVRPAECRRVTHAGVMGRPDPCESALRLSAMPPGHSPVEREWRRHDRQHFIGGEYGGLAPRGGLSGFEGCDQSIDAEHGRGLRGRQHPRERALPGLDPLGNRERAYRPGSASRGPDQGKDGDPTHRHTARNGLRWPLSGLRRIFVRERNHPGRGRRLGAAISAAAHCHSSLLDAKLPRFGA